jgi:hypothetical protein
MLYQIKDIIKNIKKAKKWNVSIIGIFGLKFGLFKEYSFNFKDIGKININQENYSNGWLYSYFFMREANLENDIMKSLFQKKDNEIIKFKSIQFYNINVWLFAERFLANNYLIDKYNSAVGGGGECN